jgi:preprotein translocase subunit YajC
VIEFLAQATKPANGTDNMLYSMTHSYFPFVLIAFAVYFMLIIPKRKKDKERQLSLSNIKRGDEITTIGGIIGKVVDPKEDRVLVKVDETSNTKIWFARSAIARVTAEDSKPAAGK